MTPLVRTSDTNSFDVWIVVASIPICLVWFAVCACAHCQPPRFPVLAQSRHSDLARRSFNL